MLAGFGGESTAGFQTGHFAGVPIGGAWKSGAPSSDERHAIQQRGKAIVFFTRAVSRCAFSRPKNFISLRQYRRQIEPGISIRCCVIVILVINNI